MTTATAIRRTSANRSRGFANANPANPANAGNGGPYSARVQAVFRQAFDVPRDPTSLEYRRGVLDALACRLEGARMAPPWPVGSVQFDAWYAGTTEGHRRASEAALAA